MADREIDALVAPLGLELPHEARVWWGWHDGSEVELVSHALGNGIGPLRLARAVEEYRGLLDAATDVATGDDTLAPEELWRRQWFPFAVPRRGHLAVQCGTGTKAPTPIRLVEFYFHEESQEPIALSLGAVVSVWINAIESGAWTYDPALPGWRTHPELLPPIQGRARDLLA
jgi:cell wall assembly regulator SMI1